MNRRSFLAGTATAGVLALSGCLSSTLNTVTSLASTPASVEQSVLDDTGYQLVGVDEIETEEDVEAAGLSDTIVVTSHLTEYEKSVGLEGFAEQATAMFSVLSTPKIEIAGRTFNPVADMSSEELVELIADNYDEIDDLEQQADESLTVLDQSVTKTQFVAEASLDGMPIDLNIHVSEAVERGDDLLVAIGVYPRVLQSEEAPNIRELTEAVSDDPADADDAEEMDDDGDEDGADESDESDESTDDQEDFDEEDFDEEDFDEEDIDDEDFDEDDLDEEDLEELL